MPLQLTPLCVFFLCLAVVTGQPGQRFVERVPRPRGPPTGSQPSPSAETRRVPFQRPSPPSRGQSPAPAPAPSADPRVASSERASLLRRQQAEAVPLRSAGGASVPGPISVLQPGSGNRQQSAGQGQAAFFGPGDAIVVGGVTYFPINGRYYINNYWYSKYIYIFWTTHCNGSF